MPILADADRTCPSCHRQRTPAEAVTYGSLCENCWVMIRCYYGGYVASMNKGVYMLTGRGDPTMVSNNCELSRDRMK
jgi:hypothetical protein